MKPLVRDICQALADRAPTSLAEPWDNSGLQVGDPEVSVGRLLVALDPTEGSLATAKRLGVDMVITHHPLLFRPLSAIDLSQPVPRLVAGFLKASIALAAGHTNLDSAPGGVSDCLAGALGVRDVRPIVPSAAGPTGAGMGRVGTLSAPVPLEAFAGEVARCLGVQGLLVAGDPAREVLRVALCGGSGSDLWPMVLKEGVDLYLSGEIRHSVACQAIDHGVALIDAGHFFTERPVVPVLASYFREVAADRQWDLAVEAWTDEPAPFGWFLAGEGSGQGRLREWMHPRVPEGDGTSG